MATHTAMAQGNDSALRYSLEQHLGILHFVSPKDRAWHGQLRTRFSDFLVHEVDKDGEVVHLHDFHTNSRDYQNSGASRQVAQQPSDGRQPKSDGTKTEVRSENTPFSGTHNSTGGSEQPKRENGSDEVLSSDKSILIDLLGQDTTDELVAFHAKIIQDPKAKPKTPGNVIIPAVSDRAKRSKIHMEIRRVFGGKIDTATDSDGIITASATNSSNQRAGYRNSNNRSQPNRQSLPGGGGKFLHFTLYKENRDTIDAVGQIARCLHIKPNFLSTAGTKDRRAVTVQRVSMRGRNPQSLLVVNERVPGVKIGDFKFEQKALYLGCHQGNEFTIVLKNCWFSGIENLPFAQKLELAKSTVESALTQLAQQGFLNYFGTQRFGTFEIGTQEVGMRILKGDFEGAVKDLLSFDPALLEASRSGQNPPLRREDVGRAQACSTFLETGDFQAALKFLPRRCNVEYTIMRHLDKSPKDFLGALTSIARGMRTMYVHAYQSLVWNFVASARWERYGDRVIKGDLVLTKSETRTDRGDDEAAGIDEETIHLAEGGAMDMDTTRLEAHALTEEEANSGNYSIYDVVLPTPGWDVIYPNNEVGEFYAEFMGKEENGGLDPNDMQRRQKDFSLPGSYRKLMGKISRTPSASIREYLDDTEQLVPTDLDIIKSCKAKEVSETKATSSGWNAFTETVQENERKEARAENERRKAQDLLELPQIRVNDTWVQTSIDGSHKRVKVARHVPDAVPDSDSAAPKADGSMQVDSQTPADRSPAIGGLTGDAAASTTVDTGNTKDSDTNQTAGQPDGKSGVSVGNEHDGGNPTEPTAAGDDELANAEAKTVPLISRLITQVRKIATKFMHPLVWLWAKLRITTDTNATKTASAIPPSESCTHITAETVPVSLNSTASTDAVPNPPDRSTQHDDSLPLTGKTQEDPSEREPAPRTEVGEASSNQTPPPSTSDATDKKIAVILRFALDTSQYATMVLRELQGAPSETGSAETA